MLCEVVVPGVAAVGRIDARRHRDERGLLLPGEEGRDVVDRLRAALGEKVVVRRGEKVEALDIREENELMRLLARLGRTAEKVPKTISRDFETVAKKRPKRPTVCVTCAGAGTAKPSSQKNDKACETA